MAHKHNILENYFAIGTALSLMWNWSGTQSFDMGTGSTPKPHPPNMPPIHLNIVIYMRAEVVDQMLIWIRTYLALWKENLVTYPETAHIE